VAVRLRTFLIGLILVILIGLVVLLFPILSNPEQLKTLIIQQVEAGLGRKIDVGEASLELFPRPRLTLSRVVIHDIDPSQVFLKARQFDLVLRSTPLLRMEIVVKRMNIEQPQITLRRDRAGQWNLLTAGVAAGSGSTMSNPLALVLMLQETALTEGVVTIVDDFRPDGLRTLELTGLRATLTAPPQGFPIDITVSGKIPTGTAESTLSLSGTVTRAAANPAIPAGAHELSLQFQGALDVQQVDLRQMMDFFGPRPIPDRIHGAATLKSRVRLVPGVVGYDMVLSDMAASVETLAIAGQANLSGIMTKQPTFALTVSATPISLDELLSHFPSQWLPAHLQRLLTEHDIKGRAEMVTATVTGSTTPAPHVSVSGEFKILDGQALLGKDKVRARNLSGTIRLDPDRLRAEDIAGEYGPMRLTAGKLAIAFLDEGPSMELDVGGRLSTAELAATLAASIKAPAVAGALAELRNVSGTTDVALRLTGFLNHPDGLRIPGAELTFRDTGFTSPKLKEPVTGLEGRLAYSPAAVEFDRITGKLGAGSLELHGAIAIGTPARYQGFTVWAQTNAGQIRSWLSATAGAEPALEGPIGMAISLAGPTTAPQLKGVIQFDQAQLSFPGALQKPAGQPAALEFDATLGQDRSVSLPRLDIIMPPVRLSGRGAVRFEPELRVDGSLIAGPIPLLGLPAGMVLGGFDSGTLEISLDLKGRGANWKRWALTGWLALTDGRFPSRNGRTVTDIYLRAKLLKNGADVKRLEFRIADSSVRMAGTIRDWRTKPVVSATIESPFLDVDLLIPKGERSPVRDFLEDLAATSRVTASIDVTRGRYKQLILSELTARLAISDEIVEVGRIGGQIEEGTLSESRLLVRLPRKKPAEGELKVQLTGFPSEKAFQLLGDEQRVIAGDLTLTAALQGNGKNPHGVADTLNGSVSFRIDDGRIEKGTIVPKILVLLDIPNRLQGKIDLKKEGMPFDSFSGSMTIENGIITTKNLLINSPVLKISGAGSYAIPADQLDLAVVVSPFGSYTKLLQGIPLFGRLLAGERKGFTTAFFDVHGSLKNPQIVNRPLKSIGAGLTGLGQLAFDVLRNTLTLPAEIFAPSEEKPTASVTPPAPAASP
jgi:hypothetical protein